jgi:hypothetical protein
LIGIVVDWVAIPAHLIKDVVVEVVIDLVDGSPEDALGDLLLPLEDAFHHVVQVETVNTDIIDHLEEVRRHTR